MQNRKWKKVLAMLLCATNILGQTIPTFAQEATSVVTVEDIVSQAEASEVLKAQEEPNTVAVEDEVLEDVELILQETSENIALGKTAVSSPPEADTVLAENAVDGDNASHNSRWGSERGEGPHWIYVDLGQEMEVKTVGIYWENRKATSYKIQVANNLSDPMKEEDWTTVKELNDRPADVIDVITLDQVQNARYVRLYIGSFTAQDPDDANKSWDTVSIYEMEIYSEEVNLPIQDPSVNVARGKTGVSSPSENDELVPAKALDGDVSGTRWSSSRGLGPHWIYVDLGRMMDVKSVRLFWETRKATSYKIQIAETLSSPMADTDWTTVKEIPTRPSKLKDTVTLDSVKRARYVRLYIDSITAEDPDGGVAWNTISIYEMEVYGGEAPVDLMDLIAVEAPEKGDTKLELVLPQADGKTITYNGTDYEQLVDDELNIYQPVVDKVATVSVKIAENADPAEYQFKEMQVTIPGQYTVEEGDNEAPNVLPELREWKGGRGVYEISESTRVVYKEEIFKDAARALAEDYELLTGEALAVVQAEEAGEGDIFFKQTTGKGLFKEGYLMNIGTKVVVEAEEYTGAYWATRTILQSIKADGNIPQGITRDYPLYEVRGLILDVGRKTFTMDFLEQAVQEMAWYKMNDFQVHLNDNYIFLEKYSQRGEDPMQAYSGFRLESDIKKGGNGGLNQADLTNKDVFYTKDDFRNLIQNARKCGVNIVPEIDVPAHSLALTKVRPDLRQGTNGRENDHLALASKFDECVGFVQSIFDEYMGKDLENPVFDENTTVHIGCDEYEAGPAAFRNFCNSMIDYVQGNNRTVRFWGSLTRLVADVEVRSEDVQVNLWSVDWARMDQMYAGGYDLINCLDSQYYIVPNAGYYFDYLNHNTMYNTPINTNSGTTIPAGDEQMLGGAFAVWNDMTDEMDTGISEYDVYDRIKTPIALFGAKLWGKNDLSLSDAENLSRELGSAPGTNFGYEAEAVDGVIAHNPMDNSDDLSEATNAYIAETNGKNALKLNGGESYVKTDLTTVGLGNDLRVKVKRTSSSNKEQILFESPYGSIKAVQKETGKVGLSRENMDYSFNYILPVNEWVELEFKNAQNRIQLYVNGELKDTLGDGETVFGGRPLVATMMFPVEIIGSKTNAFIGYVDDIRLGVNANYNSTMDLDYAMMTASQIPAETENEVLEDLIKAGQAVINKFAPEAAEIAELVMAIETELEKVTVEPADYTEVDFYLEKASKDLSIYTAESVAMVEQAKSMVSRDLPKTKQEVVDGFASVLAQALMGLEADTNVEMGYLEPAEIVAVTASSDHPEEGPAANAADGNRDTYWHSNYSNSRPTPMPHWIQIELKEAREFSKLVYVPRPGGGNGNYTGYEVQISDDGTAFTKVAEGTWTANANDKTVVFTDKVTAKYVRLVATSSVMDFGTAAEVIPVRSDVPADKDGLNAILDEAKALEKENYSETSFGALENKIAEAQALVAQESPSANAVEIMKREVMAKMAGLCLKTTLVEENDEEEPPVVVVDKAALQTVVDANKEKVQGTYTNDSWKAFTDALTAAQAVLTKAEATQEEVDAAKAALEAAISGLKTEEEPPVVPGDKTGLQSVVDGYKSTEKGNYTDASWKVFTDALTAAQTVLAKENATREELDAAKAALEAAFTGLTVEGEEPPVVTVDKAALQTVVDANKDKEQGNYTDESWSTFTTALTNAQTVLAKVDATQDEVNAAKANLVAAVSGLTEGGEQPPAVTVNKAELQSLVNEHKNKLKEDYTQASWNVFQSALQTAQTVLAHENATQYAVDTAKDNLAAAVSGLIEEPSAEVAGGSIDNEKGGITWSINARGKLTIKGKGEIPDQNPETEEKEMPWYDYRESVTSAVVELSEIKDLSYLFYCMNIYKVDLRGLDTSMTTDMSHMFHCSNPWELDLSGFDTSKVTDMSYMFLGSSSLKELDLSGFDTSQVTDMSWMFSSCQRLTKVYLTGLDLSQVTDMDWMFHDCYYLTDVDLRGVDTSKLEDTNSMFSDCGSLTSLDLSDLDTSNVWNMMGMFSRCASLTSLDLSGFDTSQVISMDGMFEECHLLTSLDLSGFDTSWLLGMEGMFAGCNSLTELNLSSFDLSRMSSVEGTAVEGMFDRCYRLEKIHTPYNVLSEEEQAKLPESDGKCWYDANGNVYTHWPQGLSYSIVLQLDDGGEQPPVTPDGGTWGDILVEDREKLNGVIPEGIWAAGIKDLTYNGTKQTQKFRVYDGNKMLIAGKDYTATIKNNQNVYALTKDDKGYKESKVPQVVLKMKGDYKGTKIITFKILPVELEGNVAADDIFVTYNGKKQTPAPAVIWNGKKLTAKDFYVKEYKAGGNFIGKEKETTELELTLVGQNNFDGEKKIKLTIGKKNAEFAMDKMKVTGVPKFVYWKKDGSTLEGFKVMNGKTQLTEGVDYTVRYENNNVVGTATMILTGTADPNAAVSYHGVKRVNFTIKGTSISIAKVSGLAKTGYPYTGKAIKPMDMNGVTVYMNKIPMDKTLFNVSYEKNVSAGTATMILTGKPERGMTGSKKVTFKITPATLDGTYRTALVGESQVVYTAGGVTPQVEVKDSKGRVLTAGVDYTVSYKNNKAVAVSNAAKAPTVVIKGKGNYTKSIEHKFTIMPKATVAGDGILNVSAKDKSLTNKAGSWKQTFKVYDVNGKALSANKDYEKTAVYYRVTKGKDEINLNDNPATTIEVGDVIKIVVTLQGNNYRGTASGTYRIIDKNNDISKAVFKIAAKEYTGEEIKLTGTDITKAELKKAPLVLDEHYEIVKYEKNINKGTAKVTFRGKGDFGGEKTVTFKIGQRNVVENWWSGVVNLLFR